MQGNIRTEKDRFTSYIAECNRSADRGIPAAADAVTEALFYVAADRAAEQAGGAAVRSCGFHASKVREKLKKNMILRFGEQQLFNVVEYCVHISRVPYSDREEKYENILTDLLVNFVPKYVYRKERGFSRETV